MSGEAGLLETVYIILLRSTAVPYVGSYIPHSAATSSNLSSRILLPSEGEGKKGNKMEEQLIFQNGVIVN